MILGTAGHIDHGKTTLVRALTGVDTDRLPEEKRRGITIDLGFAPLHLDGLDTIGVVDVPGHEAFVRTMVAGATGIDVALLVIAADEGPMPQTREHVAILRLLQIPNVIVALTKADLVEEDWLALVAEDVRSLLDGARFVEAPILPVSATTGKGIPALRGAIATAARALPARDASDLFRLPIDRVFTVRGTGTVVTGTVWSGTIRRDATVRILPEGRDARVRTLQSHGKQVDRVGPGNRAAVALVGLEVSDIARGSVIVEDGIWSPTRRLRADVVLAPSVAGRLRPRTRLRFHLGTADVGARVVLTSPEPDDRGAHAARITFDRPVVARAGDRFVLRTSAPLDTIGGGVVADPFPPARPRRWDTRLSPSDRLDRLAQESGPFGLDVASLPIRLGLGPGAIAEVTGLAAGRLVHGGGKIWERDTVDSVRHRVALLVESHHAGHPLESGMPIQLLRSGLGCPADLSDVAITRAIADGAIESGDGVVHTPGWRPVLSEDTRALADQLAATVKEAGWEPPSTDELIKTHGSSVPELLRYLGREGTVVQVEGNRYYDADQLKLLLDQLAALMPADQPRTPSELREAIGLSRKFLIPILEYCDRSGLTFGRGAGRVWRLE